MNIAVKWKKMLVFLFLILVTFIVCMLSPIDLFSKNGVSWVDSSVFKYIGSRMAQGEIPYRDMFDHKGLLLYFLNMLGYLIAPNRGVWVIEFVFMFMTVLGLYSVSRLFCNAKYSYFTVLLAMSLIFSYFEQGNLVEEYAMPFQIWSLYIYIDYFLNERISRMRVILCGLFFAGVIFLRPNMISVWLVFSLAVLVQCVKEKNTGS